MNNSQQIEKVKREFQAALNQGSERFRRAIIREIDYLYRKHGSGDLAAFLDEFQRYFNIPAPFRQAIIKDLSSAQEQIAELWQDYCEEAGVSFPDFGPNDFERMSALYKVDFSKIASDAGKVITNEIRRSIRSGAGYDALRSRLQKRSLGDAEMRTLAQTALAQFDNAMMFESPRQAASNYTTTMESSIQALSLIGDRYIHVY